VKFVLFVEGYTEKKALPAFLKRWLDPQLPQPVGMQTVRFEGWAELRKDVRKKAHLYFNGPQRDEILAVIGLLDLYGPTFYPGHLINAEARNTWAKKEIEDEVDHPRFRQFFSVHEVEAWLLSQPELFPAEVRSALPGKIAQPESVNFQQPPGKLLEQLFKEKLKYTYKKITHGKNLFDKLDPLVAYNKCPHLRELLDEMLSLAS
jgi:uncharacterized protein DUF4276